MKANRFILLFILFQIGMHVITTAQQKQFRALLVCTTRGWHHESIHSGVLALQDLGTKFFLMWC